MHNDLILPVPVLTIRQGRITPALQQHNMLLQVILKDLGYPDELVLSAESEDSAAQAITEHLPNLIFYRVADHSNLHFIQQIKNLYPSCCLISIHENEAAPNEILKAVQNGADAYLLSGTPAEQLFQQIKCILRGGAVLHPEFAKLLQEQLISKHNQEINLIFNSVEIQIMEQISQPSSEVQAALALNLSEYQVYSFIKNIFRKINILHKNAEATAE